MQMTILGRISMNSDKTPRKRPSSEFGLERFLCVSAAPGGDLAKSQKMRLTCLSRFQLRRAVIAEISRPFG